MATRTMEKIVAYNRRLGYRRGSPRFIWPSALVADVGRALDAKRTISEICRRYDLPRYAIPRIQRVWRYYQTATGRIPASSPNYVSQSLVERPTMERGARVPDLRQLPIEPFKKIFIPSVEYDGEGKPMDSRAKGLNFERQIVAEFRAKGWASACRQIETNPGAVLGIDLLNTDPFSIQCKCRARYVPISTIREVPPLPGKIPVLVTKGSHDAGESVPMVVLSLSDFLSLVSPSSPSRPTVEDF